MTTNDETTRVPMCRLEPMGEAHRKAVIDIYNYYIETSFAAYLDTKVSYEYFDRFLSVTRGFPAFVVQSENGETVGFGFLHPYHHASTFQKSVEVSYFLSPHHTGKGIGNQLLQELTEMAKDLGIENIFANVSSRNEGSINFHKKHGFHECGVMRNVGQKFNQTFDIIWMQKDLTQTAFTSSDPE
jgi:L-amino acid N-acyltransferase YncA